MYSQKGATKEPMAIDIGKGVRLKTLFIGSEVAPFWDYL